MADRANPWPGKGASQRLIMIASLAVGFIVASPAWADAVVTLCHDADETGPGTSLRTAIIAHPDPNTLINHVTFECGGPATIAFTTGGPLEIFQATSVDGGNSITLASTSASSRTSLFVVANPGNFLYLRNLVLSHSNTDRPICIPPATCPGTVINGQGVTQLDNVSIRNSYSPVSVTAGSLTISNSQFMENGGTVIDIGLGVSTLITGSVFQDNSGATPIVARGNVSITTSKFLGNGSASFFPLECQLSIDNSQFENNVDGALQINCASVAISNSLFANNSPARVGGAIRFFAGSRQIILRADRFLSNSASAGGGALWFAAPENGDISLSIGHSIFKGNQGGQGGAMLIEKPLDASKVVVKLERVSFSHNTATAGGGAIAASGTEFLTGRTVFADNSAKERGGAVLLENAAPLHSVFANSLFIRNSAASGSALLGDDADFINSTIDSNQGMAMADMTSGSRPAGRIAFKNSIVSNNPQGGCGPQGLFDDGGHNLQFPGSDCGSSIRVANPELDSMYIPLPKSAPVGNGDPMVCRTEPINGRDFYGSARLAGGLCTIGAAEGLLLRHANPGPCNCANDFVTELRRRLPFGQQ
jgi:predicted outer membrane repeat protein